MSETYTEDVPLAILDGSDDMMRVTFDYVPGAPPSPRTMAEPNGGDPGWDAEIDIAETRYIGDDGKPLMVAQLFLAEYERERVAEWLFENWEPPTGPDPDDERDRRRDDELTSRP